MFGNWVKLWNKITLIMDDLSITKQTISEVEIALDNIIKKQDEEIKSLRDELRRRTDYYENLLMTIIQSNLKSEPKVVVEQKKSSLETYLENKRNGKGLPLP